MSDRKGLLIEALFEANQSMANAMSAQTKCTYEDRLLIARLRTMLPKRVERLPTEPGWYWFRDGSSDVWEVVWVFYLTTKRLWAVGAPNGGSGAFDLAIECMPPGVFYGPLTPPEAE